MDMLSTKRLKKFWAQVDIKESNDCWLWQGSVDSGGYGIFWIGKKFIKVHRFSWILHNGTIPKAEGYHGTCVLHECDTRRCVNPNHLFLGTHTDNMRDMAKKGRVVNVKRKLGKEQVKEIRKLLSENKRLTYDAIGAMFGVQASSICQIDKGLTYKYYA